VVQITTDYLEGKLSFGDRLSFQFHLGLCSHCRAWLDQMKKTILVLGELPPDEPKAEVRDELLKRFRVTRGRGRIDRKDQRGVDLHLCPGKARPIGGLGPVGPSEQP